MADKFDPYRESLIMEEVTLWPEELDQFAASQKEQIERALHHSPEACGHLEYVRVHTGFCRQITVTQSDVDRVLASTGP